MNDLTIILLGLLGAAFLGNIIGWCAHRIVSIREESRLIARFDKEQRSLTEQLSEADERIEQLGVRNKIADNQAADLRSQMTELQGQLDRKTVVAQDTAAEQRLQQLQTELEQQTAQTGALHTQLKEERQKSAAAAMEVARRSNGSAAAQAGLQPSQPAEIPVLSRVRDHESEDAQLDTSIGSGDDPGNYRHAAADEHGVEHEIDALKYAFPDMGAGWLEVDQDLLGFSPAEEYSQGSLADAQTGVAVETDSDEVHLFDEARYEGAESRNRQDKVVPENGAAKARSSRADGMFSRFNRRKK